MTFALFFVKGVAWNINKNALPKGFVLVSDLVPDAIQDIRYYGINNFVGKRVNAYNAPVAILSREAAVALSKASKAFALQGYKIKIFDAYRPQTAVNHFVSWSKDATDTKMKEIFYPSVDKKDLFKLGYIVKNSSHSRGGTIDMTLVNIDTGKEVEMGSPFDFFDEISHHDTNKITSTQMANRLLLKNTMEQSGFNSYNSEWWHYTLKDEPYPETYFDFPVDFYEK